MTATDYLFRLAIAQHKVVGLLIDVHTKKPGRVRLQVDPSSSTTKLSGRPPSASWKMYVYDGALLGEYVNDLAYIKSEISTSVSMS